MEISTAIKDALAANGARSRLPALPAGAASVVCGPVQNVSEKGRCAMLSEQCVHPVSALPPLQPTAKAP